MKKIIFLIFCLTFILGLKKIDAQGSWVQNHYVGYAYNGEPCIVDKAVAFSIGTKGYVCTGETFGPVFLGDLWQYDAVTHAWSQLAAFPGTLRVNAVAFTIDSFGYVGTGEDSGGNALNDWWQYNPSNNTWTQKANFPGIARTLATGFCIGNKGYLGTGANADSMASYNDFWEYDPGTDSWSQKSNFGGDQRYGAVSFSIGSLGYLGNGNDGSTNCQNDIWKYDPAVDTWTYINTFGGGRYAAEACVINGKGYVAGGYNLQSSVSANDIWEFDTATSNWTYKTDLIGGALIGQAAFSIDTLGYFMCGGNYSILNEFHPSMNIWDFHGRTRSYGVGFSIGNYGYIGGGSQEDFASLNDLWKYNISTNSWSQVASCDAIGNFGLSSFVLDSNSAYVSIAAIRQLWKYEADSNVWLRKADYPGSGVGGGTFGFAIDTLGYVGGGYDSLSNTVKDFWAYSPLTNSWVRKADIGGPTRGSATAFGINHKGYVCTGDTGIISGGYGSNYPSDSSLWEYDPSIDSWSKKSNFIGNVRSGAVSFVANNLGYVGTGYTYDQGYNGIYFSDLYSYNPLQDKWGVSTTCTGTPRANAVGFSIDNNGYIGTGQIAAGCYSQYNLNDFWKFTPSCLSISQPLCLVSLDTISYKPIIVWEKANKYATDSFYLYRTVTPDSNYVQLVSLSRDSLSEWEDASAYPDSTSYRYKISVLDTCGNMSVLSPYHQTVYLSNLGQGYFTWIPYVIEGSIPSFGSVGIYRDSVGSGNWQLLILLSDTQTSVNIPDYNSYPLARYQLAYTLTNSCTPARGLTTIKSNIVSYVRPNSLNNLNDIGALKVQPNPVNDNLIISSSRIELSTITITNMLGESIYHSVMNSGSLRVDTQSWSNGVYFVTVSSPHTNATVKIVK